ncbi:beta strand repeat-containing protein [Methylomonas sp. 2BW1-5-20]|uniref:beta strand repeat-containing protein n=1 Tax=Methylomonas sp. 2BW1-5-20 TaxID=3376686 RepID=UPI00405180D9
MTRHPLGLTKNRLSLLVCILLWQSDVIAADGIATDGSVGGAARVLSAPNVATNLEIRQSDGQTHGHNLFHSFSTFNIEAGQTVTFTEDVPNSLDNVISRVTGGSGSQINGILKSTPLGHADFYLINPSGIVFGAGAQVDVPAALHVGTADEVIFNDGKHYRADLTSASELSSAAPTAFGFLGTSVANNGLIEITGSHFGVKNGQAADFVAGDIHIDSQALLTAPAGELRLVGRHGAGEVSLQPSAEGSLLLPVETPDDVNAGSIRIDNSSLITAGSGSGRIAFWGSDVDFRNHGAAVAINTGAAAAGTDAGVSVRAKTLQITNGSQLASTANAAGNAGGLSARAENILIDGQQANGSGIDTGFLSFANPGSSGRAGDVNIAATNHFEMRNGGEIINGTSGLGNSGDTTVTAHSLRIAGPTFTWFRTTGIKSASFGPGDAGNISVAADSLEIDGEYAATGGVTGIMSFASSSSSAKAGNVTIDTSGAANILNGGLVASGNWGLGHGGALSVRAAELNIAGPSRNGFGLTGIYSGSYGGYSSPTRDNAGGDIDIHVGGLNIGNGGSIFSATFGNGDSGEISLTVDVLRIDAAAGGETGVFSIAKRNSSGNSGAINIRSDGAAAILDGGMIKNATFGSGDAGDISFTAGSLLIDGRQANPLGMATGVFANIQQGSTGKSGDVYVKANGAIDILEGGEINLGNLGARQGGNATIKAASLNIDGKGHFYNDNPTGILANAFHSGNSGSIAVQTQTLNIANTGRISTSTFAGGDAGAINVLSENISIDGNGQSLLTGIASRANPGSSGAGGLINVTAIDTLSLKSQGNISTSTFGAGSGGSVRINTAKLILDNAFVTAQAVQGSGGRTGSIGIAAEQSIILTNRADISIENDASVGDPDAIAPSQLQVSAPTIQLYNSDITTRSTGNVAAGNISIDFSELLYLDPSFITTAANNGNGGSIVVTGGGLIHLLDSGFITTVDGVSGNGGNIELSAGLLLMENGLIQANTSAVGGAGGSINLSLGGLLFSGDTLAVGGNSPISWQPGVFGLNVIQAAAPSGLSGTINSSAPRLNLSGDLANLGQPQFDSSVLSPDYCGLETGSSLTRAGRGGLLPKADEWSAY